MHSHAITLRRLMARSGMTLQQLVATTGLSDNTIKAILRGKTKPHARTLHRLANGLNASPDEFFRSVPYRTSTPSASIREKIDCLLASEVSELFEALVETFYSRASNGSEPG